jgi:hypothetical protein
MRAIHLVFLFVVCGFLAGCGLGVEKGYGTWDVDHPHWIGLTILPSRMIMQTDSSDIQASGYWKDNAFWCANPDGSGDYQAAKVVAEDQLVLQLKAFAPQETGTLVCYKTSPGYDEAQQLAAANPGPVTYPPPKGAITVGMTEYKLKILPWHPDQVSQDNDNHMPEIYRFPSNDPNKPPLSVSVQNHQVISVNGGNE